LHPNTLRYRIRRVREICALDLNDADVRALTHLLLRPHHRQQDGSR
jgi:DNA-binding PucR family transcriptional regulator